MENLMRLEIEPNARMSKIYFGDTDISRHVRSVEIHARANQPQTEVWLECYSLPEAEPYTIEGVLIPAEDVTEYLAWKRARAEAAANE